MKMRKLGLIISALALVMGMSQCAKRPNMPSVDGSKSQRVTFTVTNSSGDKGAFDDLTTQLKYKWSSEDVICVYAIVDDEQGNGFVGKLHTDNEHIYDDGYRATFYSDEEMEIPGGSNKLRFVHYGSAYDLIVAGEGFDGEVSADFSEQYGTFEEVSAKVIAYCDKKINESGSYGDCTLDVQYGVAKFDFDKFFSSEESGDVTLSCIVENGLTISEKGEKSNKKGIYTTLKKNSNKNEYFVIMMPIDKSKPIKFFDNKYMSIFNLKNDVVAGKYYTKNGGGESIEIVFDDLEENGMLKGAFSAGYRECLHFAKGNLQWSANNGGSVATNHNVNGGGTAAGTWRFAPNQYDCICLDNENVSESYSGWIDLFGWGTSGWNNGNIFYQPYSSGGRDVNYAFGYGYGPTDGTSYNFDLTGTYSNSDWGVYNAIDGTFEGITPDKWLTPTFEEMKWIVGHQSDADPGVTCRTSSTIGGGENARFTQVVVDGRQGLLVFPDKFEWNIATMGGIPEYINEYGVVTPTLYTLGQFKEMEKAGVLFLPCGGYRDARAQSILISDCQTRGDYWLSTSNKDGEGVGAAYYLDFVADDATEDHHVNIRKDWGKHIGYCVRLAR